MKNNKIEKAFVFILLLFILWQLIFPLATITPSVYTNKGIESAIMPFGEILNQSSLVQEIKIDRDCNIDSIDIQLANYASTKTNRNQVVIYKNEKIACMEVILSESVKDNEFYRLDGINLKVNKGDKVKLMLSSNDGVSGNAITAWIKTEIKNNKLYKYNSSDGSYSLIDGELSMSVNIKERTLKYISEKYLGASPTITTILFVVLMLLIMFVVYQLLFLKKEEEVEDEADHTNTLL